MKLIVSFFDLFLLLAVLATVCRIVWKRHDERRFFISVDLWGYNGKLPRYVGSRKINDYIKRVRYHSRVPLARWEKVRPDIEMFYNKRVYKIESKENDVRTINIFLIEEQLPKYIEWKDDFMVDGRRFAIGESYKGKMIWDCTIFPHGLIAGATGSGKTALLRCIVHQAIAKKFNICIFEYKGSGDYNVIEQMYQNYGPIVISNPGETRNILVSLLIEVRGRLEEFKKVGVTNIDEYNARGREQFLPWLLIIDEAAEIFDVKPRSKEEKDLYAEIEQTLRTLARISRAAGVHILMGFIRPSSEVLDGQIKNNLLWRGAGYFADPAASRIVLDNDKATELPPEIKGRFIIGDEETQVYYLPVPNDSGKDNKTADDSGTGGEAEQEPPEPPAALGGGVLD